MSRNTKFDSEILISGKVILDLLPSKKGFIKKHAEYLVTCDGLGVQVWTKLVG